VPERKREIMISVYDAYREATYNLFQDDREMVKLILNPGIDPGDEMAAREKTVSLGKPNAGRH